MCRSWVQRARGTLTEPSSMRLSNWCACCMLPALVDLPLPSQEPCPSGHAPPWPQPAPWRTRRTPAPWPQPPASGQRRARRQSASQPPPAAWPPARAAGEGARPVRVGGGGSGQAWFVAWAVTSLGCSVSTARRCIAWLTARDGAAPLQGLRSLVPSKQHERSRCSTGWISCTAVTLLQLPACSTGKLPQQRRTTYNCGYNCGCCRPLLPMLLDAAPVSLLAAPSTMHLRR